jgi:uncharacterized membrane protein YphA (DoxX/SURF4 family)
MMTSPPKPKTGLATHGAALARCLLGGLFIYLGAIKALHPADYLTFVHQQLMITSPALAAAIARTAPWLEMLAGAWLLSGRAMDKAALLARWWLGCVFIFMGLHKALPAPEKFLNLVREYHMVSNYVLLNCIAAALPWFEVFCGVLLLTGVAVRAAALNVIAMLAPFSLIVLRRAILVAAAGHMPFCAVKFDCGCGAGEVFICEKLVENTCLLLLSAWLLTGRGRQCCLRFDLFPAKPPLTPAQQPAS